MVTSYGLYVLLVWKKVTKLSFIFGVRKFNNPEIYTVPFPCLELEIKLFLFKLYHYYSLNVIVAAIKGHITKFDMYIQCTYTVHMG